MRIVKYELHPSSLDYSLKIPNPIYIDKKMWKRPPSHYPGSATDSFT